MRRERQQKAFTRQVAQCAGPSLAEQVANLKLGSLTGVRGGDHTTSTATTTTTTTSSKTLSTPLSRFRKQRGPPVKTYFFVFASVICVYVIRQLPVLLSSSKTNLPLQGGQQQQPAGLPSTNRGYGIGRLRSPMLPRPGEYAAVRSTNVQPLVKLAHAPTLEYHVFSVSSLDDLPFATLTNVLMGLLDEPDVHLGIVKWNMIGNQYRTRYKNEWVENNVTIVSQTLDTDLLQLQREFRAMYKKIFFVLVDRGQPDCQADQSSPEDNNNDYNKNNNVIMCVPVEDLMYHGIEDIRIVIQRIVHRMRQEFPYFSQIDFSMEQVEALRRLDFMDNMQLQMRDLPITSAETKYGIKGGTAV